MAGTSNSGRKQLPKELKELKGTYRKDRDNGDMPTGNISNKTKAPKELSKKAKKEYTEKAKQLISQGVLKEGDESFLAVYADAYGNWIECVENIKNNGKVYVDSESGELKINPYVKIANKYVDIMKSFGSEFGLSPASRTKIRVEKQEKEENKFTKLGCRVIQMKSN